MVQRNPKEKATLNEVVSLADQLNPGDQERLIEHMKLQWLRREIQKGLDEVESGQLVDGDQAFEQLIHLYKNRSEQE